jgi:hypothetical protein
MEVDRTSHQKGLKQTSVRGFGKLKHYPAQGIGLFRFIHHIDGHAAPGGGLKGLSKTPLDLKHN